MIHKVVKGQGFRGVLNYVHEKPGARRIGGNMAGRTPRELAREFGETRQLRPTLRRPVFHASLRVAPGDTLTEEQWRVVGDRFAAGMGFASSPYAVYLHTDDAQEHIHIVASRIQFDGRVVPDSKDYERGMKIMREFERDYGLRILAHEDAPLRSPTQAERKLAERTGMPSSRSRVQEAVHRAAEGRPSFSTFAARLRERGIEPVAHVASTGRVQGISFVCGEATYKGSDLGRTCSWQGLIRQGLSYLPERDLPHLLPESRRQAPARSPAAPGPLDPDFRSQADDHLRALGSGQFEVLFVDHRTGARDVRAMSGADILAGIDEIARRNRDGWDVLLRPVHRHHHLVIEVPQTGVASARRRGFQPAATVAIGGDRHEVWFLDRQATTPAEKPYVTALLSRELGVDPGRAPSDFGHLAGLVSYADPAKTVSSEARLVEATGAQYRGFERTLDRARRILEDKGTSSAVAAEVRQIVEHSRGAGLPLPFDAPEQRTDLARRWQRALESWERAESRPASVPPEAMAAANEKAVLAYRELRQTVDDIEIIAGRRLPPALRPQDLPEYLHVLSRLETLSSTSPAPRSSSPPSADQLALQALLERRAVFDRAAGPSTGPSPALVQVLSRSDAELLSAWTNASSPAAILRTEIALEAHRFDLRTAARQHAADLEPLGRDLRQAEQTVRGWATGPTVERYQQSLEAYLRAETRLLDIHRRLEAAERLAEGRDLARGRQASAPASLTTSQGPGRRPSAPTSPRDERIEDLLAAREVRAARRELQSAAEVAATNPRSREINVRVAQALERFSAAQERLADRLSRNAGPVSLPALLDRVRHGDYSSSTLAALERRLAASFGPPPEVAGRASRRPLTIERLLSDHAAARTDLRSALAGAARDASLTSEHAVRLQKAVGALRQHAAALDRLGGRLHDPSRQVLPVRSFLRHPSFQRRQDALRAWAAHAARRGVPEAQIRRTLGRTSASSSTALTVGMRAAGAVARFAVHWAAYAALWAAKQLVRSR